MSPRTKIRERAREPFSQSELDLIVERAVVSAETPRRAPRRPPVAVLGALAASALLGVWLTRSDTQGVPADTSSARSVEAPSRAADPEEAGPLRTLEGEEPQVFASGASRSDGPWSETQLSDLSRVRVSDGARVEVIENTGSRFVLAMHDGEARLTVTPHGPRRWSMSCRGVEIVVVGTELAVHCDARSIRVEVMHGVVEVRGDRVPSRRVELFAPDTLEVHLDDAAPDLPLPPVAAEPPPAAVPPRRSAAAEPPARTAVEAERVPTATLVELLDLADSERLAGRPAEAARALERVLAEHPESEAAASAAFSLGRIRADALHDPAGAALAFERALALGVPHALEESALARLAEAREASGDSPGARAAWDALRERYPRSRLLPP